MRLLIKMPTRQRPTKALNLVAKYIEMASGSHPFHFVISTHVPDKTMNTAEVDKQVQQLQQQAQAKGITLSHVKHNGTTKIHAYNSDPKCPDWDIQVATSDDMVPKIHGYDAIIVETMQAVFPDTKGVLHFADGFTKLMTLPIVGRAWYNQFGYIYNPEYISLYCDNEMEDVAQYLKQYHYSSEVIIRHEHPVNVKQPVDALLRHTESFYAKDRATYLRRKKLHFGLRMVNNVWTVKATTNARP